MEAHALVSRYLTHIGLFPVQLTVILNCIDFDFFFGICCTSYVVNSSSNRIRYSSFFFQEKRTGLFKVTCNKFGVFVVITFFLSIFTSEFEHLFRL
jgi:hypothetical protein